MLSIKRFTLLLTLSVFMLGNSAIAQNQLGVNTAERAAPAVTASLSGTDSVRFAAPGQVLQIRLEILGIDGQLVSDTGTRAGSIVDWKVSDASQTLTDGQYLTVVTVRDFQGKFRQRIGGLTLQSGQVTLKNFGSEELSAAQLQALGVRRQAQKVEAANNDDAVTILRDGKERSVVVTAHDGQDGQVATTSGALSFRTGDFFSNRAKEQMRIMPDGRVGIGTDKPEATLDVAGTIRARGGIRFEDGTVLNSGAAVARGVTAGGILAANGTTATATGTGTTGRVAKWTDGTNSVLGDSALFESGSNVGIGTATPTTPLDINGAASFGNLGQGRMKVDNSSAGNNVTFNVTGSNGYLYFNPSSGFSIFKAPTNTLAQFQVESSGTSNLSGAVRTWNGTNNANAPLLFYTAGVDLNTNSLQAGDIKFYPGLSYDLTTRIGNHSIFFSPSGTGNTVLENGNLKLNAVGSGIIFQDGSKLTSANGVGGAPTGTGIVAAINDPGTAGLIGDNRVSANLARLNAANNWTNANVFSGGLSANGGQITGVGDPLNSTDAVNKAYLDTNAVRFVPGAEQLSVGDANGTAPMINLRGGSTCCSGPGGHTPAFFKVFQNGSFVATGNLGIGVSPMEGKGYRTSWHTYKGAFRSGYADNEWDDANTGFLSWAGGSNSTASGLYAFAFGDTNFARSTSSIAFGSGNEVKGAAGFSAGAGNRVCDTYGVALGNNARSGGPYINGKCDTETFNITGLAAVAIGYNVTADKDHSTAMGKFASNNGFAGTFVWSDGSAAASADTFKNTANNEFAARATGGFRFRTNLTGTTGCNLPAGSGVFNCTSSRATKANFMMVSGEDVLSRLRAIPVSTWNYVSEGNDTRHMGPMAEDFYQAFKLGTGNTSIGVQDLTGVSLAAIKALDQRTNELQQKTAEVEQLRTQVSELRSANNALEKRLEAIEQNMKVASTRQNRKRAHR